MKFEGKPLTGDYKILIIVSRFNENITNDLLTGSKQCFLENGGNEDAEIMFEHYMASL